jgi:hypothetical protein
MPQANASTQHASLRSFAAKMAFVQLWSGGLSVEKIAVEYAPPLTLLALRYGCSICLLVPHPFCRPLKRKNPPEGGKMIRRWDALR